MKIFTKFLFFLLIIFLLNILLYFVSTDYKKFLKSIKYSDDIITISGSSDENIENNIDIEDNINDETIADSQIIKISENDLIEDEKTPDNINNDITIKKEVVLWKNYKDIIARFTSKYTLKKIEVNSGLFELTNEYPDYYYEYYSENLTLYLFPTRTYIEIYDIFDYLSQDLPFELNEINNFWDNSFYINLKEDIKDNYVRMVISNDWITFWLKIKKLEYENVKNILNGS